MEKIQLFKTTVTDLAKNFVKEVLDSTWLNEGKYVKQFESALESLGYHNAVTTNSCTSALHLSLLVAGVGPGDEVILPAQTFIATGMAVLQAGAKPVFADIDVNTGNIDPRDIKRKITPRTKAIIPVHWGGKPCYMEQIYDMAGNIPVIDDAAHAFGIPTTVGSTKYSDFTCFSLQAIKSLTSGDGGFICVKDPVALEEIKRRKWFGIDRTHMTTKFEGDRDVTIREVGYKYHMNDVAAALAYGNLDGHGWRLSRRQEIGARYREELLDVYGVSLLKPAVEHAYWVFTMRVEGRQGFINKMRKAGIDVSVMDRRIDLHPVFGGVTPGLVGQEEFDNTQISIPVHSGLSDEQVDHIIKTVKGGW